MLLRPGQALECERQDLAGHVRTRWSAKDADAGSVDRLGEEVVRGIGLETEGLARQMECAYLPAAIGEQTVDADRSEFDLVKGASLLALGVDFGASREEADRRCWPVEDGRVALVREIRRQFDLGGCLSVHGGVPCEFLTTAIAQNRPCRNSVISLGETT